MRLRRRAVFGIDKEEWRRAQELFVRLGVVHLALEDRPRPGFYTLDFPDEEGLAVFLARADSIGLSRPTVRRWLEYTERDLREADLLVMWVGGPWRHRGLAVPWPGTDYDRSKACPACGAGIVPLAPLRLKRSDVPRTTRYAIRQIDFRTHLIAPPLARALRIARVSGMALHPVVPLRGGSRLPWFHLVVPTDLPPWSSTSTGVERSSSLERPCPICGRDGYFGTQEQPFQIAYGPDLPLSDLPDMTRSWEHFGAGSLIEPFGESRLSAPLLVVKQKVRMVLKAQAIRTVRFTPVRLEGPHHGWT